MYDAVWVYGLTIERGNTLQVDALNDILPETASGYSGALGPTDLNDAGILQVPITSCSGFRTGSGRHTGFMMPRQMNSQKTPGHDAGVLIC